MTGAAILLAAILAGDPAAIALHIPIGARPAQQPETITAIQIRGNTLTSDDEVRRLATIDVGMPLEATTIDEVAARLRRTGRFKQVDVRTRFASIDDPSQIVLLVVVDEGAVRIETSSESAQATRVVKKRWPAVMFLPVLSGEDGYGLTYGARFALVTPLGRNSRVAFPLTWGGTKQAAVEAEKRFDTGPLSRVVGSAQLSRRTNPFFDRDDSRRRIAVRGERELVRAVRAGGFASLEHAGFDTASDTFNRSGGDIVVDTRLDPVLPRNAVYGRASWTRFAFSNPSDGGNDVRHQTEIEARGFIGLTGQNILTVSAQRTDSDRPMISYLQPLLGGMANLRGFEAGYAAGDTLVAMSAEVIVPLTSPLNVGKMGVNVFTDVGTTYTKGERFADQALRQGYGAGVWFSAAFLRLNVAVAHGRGSSTRVHAGGTVSF